jgi:hypothetical protein
VADDRAGLAAAPTTTSDTFTYDDSVHAQARTCSYQSSRATTDAARERRPL